VVQIDFIAERCYEFASTARRLIPGRTCEYRLCASVSGLLALGANQVAHWRHIGGVAGEPKAAQFPASLDGGEH